MGIEPLKVGYTSNEIFDSGETGGTSGANAMADVINRIVTGNETTFGDLFDSADHPHTDSASGGLLTIGSVVSTKFIQAGTITVQDTTEAVNIDYADVAIGAGDLTAMDTIIIELWAQRKNGTKNMKCTIAIRDVTATGNVVTLGDLSADPNRGSSKIHIFQNSDDTDVMQGRFYTHTGASVIEGSGSVDTNDANVFTTAFTIRINGYYAATADGENKLNYKIYKRLGQ